VLPLADSAISFTVLGVMVMLCFGGGVGTMPALAADAFGSRHVGEVMGLLLTAQGFGAILGPLLLAGARDLTGSYTAAILGLAAIMALSAWLPLRMGPGATGATITPHHPLAA
jgi:OFA family oxalate/formate antiporter-like MFS transporter